MSITIFEIINQGLQDTIIFHIQNLRLYSDHPNQSKSLFHIAIK